MDNTDTCELCNRENFKNLTEHHLTPREEGGSKLPTINICSDCHRQIHALYTNKELAIRLNTLQDLKNDYKISKFLKYISKQPSSKSIRVKKSKEIAKKGLSH